MEFVVYDFEVFQHDWVVVFKKEGEHIVIKNDVALLSQFYEENKKNIFVGFNNKHFDDYIFKGILSGIKPKKISDWIIYDGKFGWQYPGIINKRIISYDVKQDVSRNLTMSLKEAEGNMGMDIEETEVDFNLDRKLTEEEMNSTIKYCKHDVDATEMILLKRIGDVKSRLELLQMFSLPITNIGKTNAQLCAIVLDARKKDYVDEFIYDLPSNVQVDNQEVLMLYKSPIDYEKTLTTKVCGVDHLFAYGGLHGAKKGYFEGNIWYVDVQSYYPSLMIEYNFGSRSLRTPTKYKDIYDLRLNYKKQGNSAEKPLKLVLNTTYGAMKNKYNALFDPKQANQVCITGQLLLLDLLEKLEPYIELIQSNTDGLLFKSFNDTKCREIVDEWQTRSKMGFKIEKVDKMWQKDVNNYIMLKGDKLEVKGGYVRDYKGGDFARNETTIIDEAVVNYFVHDIKPEITIGNCDDLIRFQYICKKGPTYTHVKQDGVRVKNVNRVFATLDTTKGNLYKVKEDGRKDSIAGLPTHCQIINDDLSNMTFDKLDKQWYITQAYDRINDFLKG